MRWLPRALATTTACVLLAGCGGNPTPAPPPKATSAPSPTASASPTPPALPAVVQTKTKAGAIAATRHFLQTMAFAGNSGDVTSFKADYLASCTRCAAISDGITRAYNAGARLSGGEWKPTAFKFYDIDQDVAYLDAVVTFEPQTVVQKSGAKRTDPGSEGNLKTFQLRWREGRWRVAALDPRV